MRPLALRIATMQNGIVRDLNDIHIFIRQALPLLQDARESHAGSTHQKDRRYFVPSVARSKFAERTDHELRSIYDRFTNQRLYESFLITAVAEFESFLARVLEEVIHEYPQKLSVSVSGVAACKNVPTEILLRSGTLAEVLNEVITQHVSGIFYASPQAYLEYLGKITGADTSDKAFLNFIEIKATRDILVHNSRRANAVYLSKAGARSRALEGDELLIDSSYFDHVIANLKRLSGIIKRDAGKTFKVTKPEAEQAASCNLYQPPCFDDFS